MVACAGGVIWVFLDGDSDSPSLATCRSPLDAGAVRLEVGDRVPDFTLPSLDGDCIRFADFRGRPLVINFWASWCNPCREEFPLLRAARADHAADDLEILGITHDDIPTDSLRFAEEQDAEWPMLVDDDDAVADLFGIRPIPHTFFVDRRGRIRSEIFLLTNARELEAEIRRIVNR